MRTKYQTRASQAEEQVMDLLKSDKSIHVPWSLVNLNLESRTLQTTAAEAALLFNNLASVRPGYEQDDKTVFVPNLFIKLSGQDADYSIFDNKEELAGRKDCFFFDSFDAFPSNYSEEDFGSIIKDGTVQKEAALASRAFTYTFLRREYQEIFIDKVNEIIKNKNDFFLGKGLNISDTEIVSYCFTVDESFIQAFHNFDFQFQTPAVVIFNRGKEIPTNRQAVALVLLNLLGFDIVIWSKQGHADIENVLNPEVYNIYYGRGNEPVIKKKPTALRNIAAVFIVLALITGAIILLSQPPKVTTNAGTSIVNQPEEIASSNDYITFKDKELEKEIRKILKMPTGDIMIKGIGKTLRFIGPFSGDAYLSFNLISSTSSYRNGNSAAYTEQGKITDASDLISVPGLDYLEFSWQKHFDINSLANFKMKKLSLVHDFLIDISALGSLGNLRELDLEFNSISDISPLKSMSLERLNLNYNQIADITPLADMESLKYLDLSNNLIKDLSALSNLGSLGKLMLINLPCVDFNFLSSLDNLRELTINTSAAYKFEAIKYLNNLTRLSLYNTRFSNIEILENLDKLEYLDLSHTGVYSLDGIEKLKNLTELRLDFSRVTDISKLKDLRALKRLSIQGLKLEDENVLKEIRAQIIR